ncbi:MAG TPA: AraC family transcriptional regulator [Kofleriaceae bacterium]|nr:AraC family transcriptional regulator [Kofleriaceae bacterium]
MPRDLGNLATPARPAARTVADASASRLGPALPGAPSRPCGYHSLGEHPTFSARDCVCIEDARSPAFEGHYPRVRIGVILAGGFHARSSRGAVLVGPGAMLLGNAGAPYEYRHVDDGGDRSIVFDYEESLLEDVRRSIGAPARGEIAFDAACLPASARSAAAAALARDALRSGEPQALHEAALAVLAAALLARRGAPAPAPARHHREVAQAMRYVADHVADDCSLDALARRAGLSTFHFLRTFRAHTGQTPRQFVIAARLRAAAAALRATRVPITRIALDAGFGDLSHFNASFARSFGTSPRAYRRR